MDNLCLLHKIFTGQVSAEKRDFLLILTKKHTKTSFPRNSKENEVKVINLN